MKGFLSYFKGGGEDEPSVCRSDPGSSTMSFDSRVRLFSHEIWVLPPLEASPVQTSMCRRLEEDQSLAMVGWGKRRVSDRDACDEGMVERRGERKTNCIARRDPRNARICGGTGCR